MKDVKITVIRKNEYPDLMEKYENKIEHACSLNEGEVFISHNGTRPSNLCESAWGSMKEFVIELANGGGNFYGGWMQNPKSAMISCNDGFRPVSFLIEALDQDSPILENSEEILIKEASDNETTNDIYLAQNESKKEKFNDFKKSYKKAGANALRFFLIMQVICSVFLTIGAIFGSILTIIDIGIENIEYTDFFDLINMILYGKYAILLPIGYIIGYIGTVILTYFWNKKKVYEGKNSEFSNEIKNNIKRKLSFKEMILIIIVAFGLWGVGAAFGNINEFFNVSPGSDAEIIFGSAPILYLLMACFGAPFIEEIVFRKFFIDATKKQGELLAVFTSALFFGLVHGNTGQFFLAFLLGILFGIVYIKTNNILYTMGLHFMINFYASIEDIFALFNNVNMELVDLIWNIVTLGLIIAGIIVLLINRKKELFNVSNKVTIRGDAIFKVGTIKIFYIVNMVLVFVTAGTTLLNLLTMGDLSPLVLTYFIPIIAFIILICFKNAIYKNMFEVIKEDEIIKEDKNQNDEVISD